MKKWVLIGLLFIVGAAYGQRYLVNFFPDNQPYYGLTNFPKVVSAVAFTTNAIGWQTNMSVSDYDAYYNSMRSLYDAAVSNMVFTASINTSSNQAAWYAMYTQIPQGIADSSNRIVNLGSLLASWNSGTNNAAGTNSIIKQTMQHVQVSYQYLNQIIVYLSRLGPGLQQVYQPANDPVGH